VREVVEAAGVTKPVLYYYFGSKEGIYTEIMKEAVERFRQRLINSNLQGESVRERIHHLCQKTYALVHENLKVVRLIHSIGYGPPQGAPQCIGLETFHELFHETITRLVREGLSSGEFIGGKEDVMANAIEGAFNITIEQEMANPERSIGEEGLNSVLDVIFDGMTEPTKRPRKGQRV
jgi:AcrR family transcriptional regulator